MLLQSDFSAHRGIPFAQLVLAPENVRKEYSESAILELATLIEARGGVIQNLAVYEAPKKPRGAKQFAVVAGGRRWRALNHLLKEGKIQRDYLVPCKVTSKEAATAISLAENKREDLHPADEFSAFKAMVDAGETVEEVAAQFGVDPLAVQRRLKLANVAPEFIQLYRDKTITLEHLMAFAACDDHEKQRRVWKGLPAHSRFPHSIRHALTETEISARDPIARFVTVKAYEKAGGLCRRDLFSDENEVFLLNPELLNTLAQTKLEKKAQELKEQGAAWVDVSARLDVSERAGYGRVGSSLRTPNKKEATKLKSLDDRRASVDAEIQRLEEIPEEVESEAFEALEDQREKLESERNALLATMQVPNPEQQAKAGALVSIDRNGTLRVEAGVLKAADAKLFAAQARRQAKPDDSEAPREHSASLLQSVTAHRTIALRVVFAQNPEVALASIVHRFVLETFECYPFHSESPLQIRLPEVGLTQLADDLKSTPAYAWIEKQQTHWQSVLPKDPQALFQWILEQSHAEKLALLAFCASPTLDAVQSTEKESDADMLAQALQIDLRQWWTPNATGYFSRIAKPAILQAVVEAVSPEASAPLEPLKKKALAEEAEKLVAGKGWLPKFLRKSWMNAHNNTNSG